MEINNQSEIGLSLLFSSHCYQSLLSNFCRNNTATKNAIISG